MTVTVSPIIIGIPLPDAPPPIVPVVDTAFLAREINDAHKQIMFHGRSMLLEAKRAGDALLEAKKMVRHGEFKMWVEQNCKCSYRSAREYMQVAKLADLRQIDVETFEGGIRAFLEAHSTRSSTKPTPAAPAFTQDDATRALKIHALAEHGLTEGERSVARNKLDAFAKRFNASADDLVRQANRMLPDRETSDRQIKPEQAENTCNYAACDTPSIRKKVDDLKKRFQVLSKDELIDLCVKLTLQNEGFVE